MKKKKIIKQDKTKERLIFLSIVLIVINFIMILFIFLSIKSLQNDARMINQIGIIRGSIQRISKLEVANQVELSKKLTIETDNLIHSFMTKNGHNKLLEKSIHDCIIKIDVSWRNLKTYFLIYRKTQNKNNLDNLLQESKNCWEIANETVLKAQYRAETKVYKINFIYFLLIIYTINTFLILLVVISYIRKNFEFWASHDSMTKLLNRHSYKSLIESELERANRYKHPLTLLLFDIDHYKKINDNYGHKIGDMILIELSNVILTCTRANDAIFRMGGDEFSIILPETDSQNAKILAKKLRQKVEQHHYTNNIEITISIGIAQSKVGISSSDIYQNADKALYSAKDSGRNRVKIFN